MRPSGDGMRQSGASPSYTNMGNVSMAPGKVFTAAAGTLAASSIRFAGSDPGSGFSAQVADNISLGRIGAQQFLTNVQGTSFFAVVAFGSTAAFTARMTLTTVTSAVDYLLLSTDRAVVMNVTAGGTLTLPATAATGQWVQGFNASANPLTIANNGATINGVAGSVSIAAGAGFEMLATAGAVWRISESPPA